MVAASVPLSFEQTRLESSESSDLLGVRMILGAYLQFFNFSSLYVDVFKCLKCFRHIFPKTWCLSPVPRQMFIATQSNSRETAGDAIFNAIFEAAPSLQTLLLGKALDLRHIARALTLPLICMGSWAARNRYWL